MKTYAGESSLVDVVQMEDVDLVLTALVGYSGLKPTIAAIEAGKPIALANKETLVVAGELITQLADQKEVPIYPVDSEHSAIFQCLAGEFHNKIEKIYRFNAQIKFHYSPFLPFNHCRTERQSRFLAILSKMLDNSFEQ